MSFEELLGAAHGKVPCLFKGENSCGDGLQRSYLSDAEADSSEKRPELLRRSDAVTRGAVGSVAVNLSGSPCGPAAKCDGQQLHLKARRTWADAAG